MLCYMPNAEGTHMMIQISHFIIIINFMKKKEEILRYVGQNATHSNVTVEFFTVFFVRAFN